MLKTHMSMARALREKRIMLTGGGGAGEGPFDDCLLDCPH